MSAPQTSIPARLIFPRRSTSQTICVISWVAAPTFPHTAYVSIGRSQAPTPTRPWRGSSPCLGRASRHFLHARAARPALICPASIVDLCKQGWPSYASFSLLCGPGCAVSEMCRLCRLRHRDSGLQASIHSQRERQQPSPLPFCQWFAQSNTTAKRH